MSNKQIFTPEQFGAVADGIHDDGQAIWDAVLAAGKDGIVKFAPNATYFVNEVPDGAVGKAGITLTDTDGLTVEGENTKLIVGRVMPYFNIQSCKNTTLKGFVFEMRPHASFRGRLVSVNREQVSAVITTDEPVANMEDSFDYCDYKAGNGPYSFAMPDDQWRMHLYLRKIEKIEGENTYRVWFALDRPTRDALKTVMDKRCDIIMPTPKVGHSGVAFHVLGSSDVHVEDCNIKEASQFVGAIKGNPGPLYFTRVDESWEDDGDQPMVGWRDGYHCKDNTGPIHWKGCRIGRLYDDAFNVSCTCLTVFDQPSDWEIHLRNLEINGCYYGVHAGDTFSVYDTYSGKIISEGNRIAEVIKQHGADLRVRPEKPIPPVDKESTRVVFESHVAPGSTITDCQVKGTVRLRGPVTVTNTDFDLMMMWTQNEWHIEGPVPRDMLFENCTFKGTYPVAERYLERYLSFGTEMRWPGVPEYKLKNIRLRNCKLDSRYTHVEEGNDVRFENCVENDDGRPIKEIL